MKKPLKNLSETEQRSIIDLSKWGYFIFVDICSETAVSRNLNTTNSSSVDQLFLFDEVPLV